jgi:hypothetical protein
LRRLHRHSLRASSRCSGRRGHRGSGHLLPDPNLRTPTAQHLNPLGLESLRLAEHDVLQRQLIRALRGCKYGSGGAYSPPSTMSSSTSCRRSSIAPRSVSKRFMSGNSSSSCPTSGGIHPACTYSVIVCGVSRPDRRAGCWSGRRESSSRPAPDRSRSTSASAWLACRARGPRNRLPLRQCPSRRRCSCLSRSI